MHPTRYPTDASRVGLVGTLLTSTILSWFAPLLETNSPLLNNFEEFIKELKACFGDTDSARTAINKIRILREEHQHMHPIFVLLQEIFLGMNKP